MSNSPTWRAQKRHSAADGSIDLPIEMKINRQLAAFEFKKATIVAWNDARRTRVHSAF
jgi:hypothetical protein